jgi:hypothetical protein
VEQKARGSIKASGTFEFLTTANPHNRQPAEIPTKIKKVQFAHLRSFISSLALSFDIIEIIYTFVDITDTHYTPLLCWLNTQ